MWIPDMMLSINDFHNHIEIAIQTHGYDEWQGGESNLLVTTCLTARLSNTSYMGFQYDVQDAVEHLVTNGIIAIPEDTQAQATEREIILLKELLKDKDKEFKQMIKDQAKEFAKKLAEEQSCLLGET